MSEPAISGSHLELESIAAFLDGRLAAGEREAVVTHLAECEGCYEIFAETARYLRNVEMGRDPEAFGPAAMAPSVEMRGRVVRVAPSRWRRGWIVGALAAAAALAALVIGRPLADRPFSSAPPTVAELTAELPTAMVVSATLAATWDEHGWPVMRGAGPLLGPEEERAFQLGVRVVEMDVALAAGEAAIASRLSYEIERLLAAVNLSDPLQLLYAGELGIRGRLASGAVPAELLPLNRQGDDLLRPDERGEAALVDGFWYELGRWASAAHLAVVSGDAELLASKQTRRYLHGLPLQDLPEEVAEPLRRISQFSVGDPEHNLTEIAHQLELLIAVAGGADPSSPTPRDSSSTRDSR